MATTNEQDLDQGVTGLVTQFGGEEKMVWPGEECLVIIKGTNGRRSEQSRVTYQETLGGKDPVHVLVNRAKGEIILAPEEAREREYLIFPTFKSRE